MTAWGWVFMVTSVSFVTVLTIWCFSRVLGGSGKAERRPEEAYASRGASWESQRQQALRTESQRQRALRAAEAEKAKRTGE